MGAKDALFRAAHGCGLLSLYGRHKASGALTVVGFHRVLPTDDPRWPGADPNWTVSAELFAECLDFLQRNFIIVSAQAVADAAAGRAALAKGALLLTFDDGWADTAEFAAAELERRQLPSILFAATGAIGRREAFWQERIVSAERTGRLTEEVAAAMAGAAGLAANTSASPGSGAILIDALAVVPAAARDRALAMLPNEPDGMPDQMMSREAIAALPARGMAVGGHGVCHLPIPECADPAGELRACFAGLAQLLGAGVMPMLSFPHGRYRPQDIAAAQAAGFSVLFTSDRGLNAAAAGRPAAVLGRIEITAAVAGSDGRLDAQRLARWLFGQPVLAGPGGQAAVP